MGRARPHRRPADDFRKEITLHPDSDFAWDSLIGLQVRSDYKAAEASARGWVAASPDKLAPYVALSRILWDADQDAAALNAANQGAAALPGYLRESNAYQLLLGEAELRGGAIAAGVERLSHLIQSDAPPLEINDANFELARARQQLPLAERSQREVLKRLEAETLAWTGDEPEPTLRNASVLLSAAWDTMGWILYQQGRYAEAEGYIHAAWRNRPSADIGEHLGDVQAALHRNREAARTYQLAEFVANGASGTSATLKKKADTSRQRDPIDLGGITPAASLASERTFPLPAAADLAGTAVYQVLFTNNAVVRIKPAPGGTPAALDAAIREAKLAALFPPGESAALFQTVALTCKSGSCSVRLEP